MFNTSRLLLAVGLMTCISLLTLSCHKRTKDCPSGQPQYQPLTSSARDWFPYTGNVSLVFEKSSGEKDTLQLTNYSLVDDDIWVGDECPVTKGQFLRGNILDKKTADTLQVEIGYGEQVLIRKGSSYILYFDTKNVVLLSSNYRRLESSFTLNNKTYNNVLVYECSPTDKCNSTGITKFYFAKTKGLVAFEANGSIWTLK